MKKLIAILCLCMLLLALTSCQPVSTETTGSSEERSAQIDEADVTEVPEESSPVEETEKSGADVSGEFSSEETESEEMPTGYPEGEIPAELIMVSGVLYVFDESAPQDWTLPQGSNMIGQIKSVVTTEEPKRDFEAAHVELRTEIYWNIKYLDYIYAKRPGSDRYERFVQISEKEKWWTEEALEEIEYIVEPVGDVYYMYPDQFAKEGGNYVLTGEQRHEVPLSLTYYQKESLDAGAVMNVIYKDELLLKVTSKVSTVGGLKFVYKIVQFSGEEIVRVSSGMRVQAITSEPWVEEPPFSGIAYKIVNDGGAVSYMIPVEREHQIDVSGDTPIETLVGSQKGETMMLDQFYERRVVSEDGTISSKLKIYEENGKVVRIVECYVP